MTDEQKRATALRLLAETGMSRFNYAPPLSRALWWLGFEVPPPHFASARTNAVVFGTGFAISFSLVMWVIEGTGSNKPLWAILLEVAISGVLFGFYMARYFASERRKYGLPAWDAL